MPTNAPAAAKPTRHIFDAFNSSATGHQRADNRLSGSTSWRDSRKLKLNEQFTSGAGGGKRVNDTVGAGSLDFGQDGRTENGGWVKGARGLRAGGQRSLYETMGVEKEVERPAKKVELGDEVNSTSLVNPYTPFRREDGKIRETSWTSHESSPSHHLSPIGPRTSEPSAPEPAPQADEHQDAEPPPKESALQVFRSCTFYINGSTAPTISDHKLKHLLRAHGASLSIALGRRTVTHVIIGRPSSNGGCGGGLSGSKIQKEVTRLRGNAVKFVTVDWVIESVKAGKRLPDGRFEALRLAPKGVGSVAEMFGASKQAAGSEAG